MKIQRILPIFLTLIFFASCGKAYKNGGNCDPQVVADYNSICSYDSREVCEANLKTFKNKYPGINCTASTGYGLHESTIRIDKYHLEHLPSTWKSYRDR